LKKSRNLAIIHQGKKKHSSCLPTRLFIIIIIIIILATHARTQ
jgi:hypothetical protein